MARWSIGAGGWSVFALAVGGGLLFSPRATALSPVSVALSAPAGALGYGQQAALTVNVTPSSATGRITFFDGVNPLGISVLSGGAATLSTRALAPGTHSLWAYYSGDSFFTAAKSAAAASLVQTAAQAGFSWTAAMAANTNPVAIATGDFNADGHTDLAVANYGSGDITVLLGNGDGTFRSGVNVSAGQAPSAIAAGDFNGDGKTDLAVTNSGDDTLSILAGNGDGTFRAATNYPTGTMPCSMASGDFNGDGLIDVAVSNCGDANISIFLGALNGPFQAAVNYSAGNVPSFVAVSDFNGDGYADLAIANAGDGTVTILAGRGDGTFQTGVAYPTNNFPLSIATADFNLDGRQDLAVSGADNIAILLNSGSGNFAAPVGYTAGSQPYSIIAADLTGDGVVDLAAADSAGNAITVLQGNGDGTFQTAAAGTSMAGNAPAFIAMGGFNGDGLPDLAVADDGGGVSILSGTAPAGLTMNCLVPASPLVLNSAAWSAPCSLSSGTPPYYWSISSGTPPAGMFLSSATGSTVTVKGTPIESGIYSFTVTATDSSSPSAQSASRTFSGAIGAVAAVLGSISPSAVPANSTSFTLTVNGSGFQNGAAIDWNGSPAPTTFISSAQLTASIPAQATASPASVNITVVNPGAPSSGAAALSVDPLPVISSLSPASAIAGGAAFALTVNGIGFSAGSVVKWNGAPLTTTFVSSVQLTAAVAAPLIATSGSATVTVTNPDSGVSSVKAFAINAPSGGGSTGGGSTGGGSTGGGSTGGGSTGGGSTGGGSTGGGTTGGGSSSSGSGTLSVSTASLAFTWQPGGAAPSPQAIGIFIGISAGAYSATAQTSSGSSWLHVSSASGKTPASIVVSIDTTVLSTSAQTYTGSISIAGPSNTIKLPVTVTALASPPPVFTVDAMSAVFTAVEGSGAQSGQITVRNTGGGSVNYSASVSSGTTGWLKIATGAAGSATAASPAPVSFTVDPSSTGPGVFSGSLQITDSASGQTVDIPVTMTVSAGSNTLILSQTALGFAATPQQPSAAVQTFAVAASGAGSLAFAVHSSTAWLQAAPTAGQTSAANPVSVSVSANATGMQFGVYYGSIDVTAPGAVNSPQTLTVILNVSTSGSGTTVSPSGLGITLMGSTPQSLSVPDPAGAATGFATSVSTADGGSWLSVTPATAVTKGGPAPLTISANPAKSGSGIHHGTISVGFDDGAVQTIPVTLIPAAAGCAPSALVLSTGGAGGGSVAAGTPQPIQAWIMDDCGNPATGASASAQATFSNGDAPVNLVYSGSSAAGGLWQGTWIPANASNQMQMQLTARQGALTPASTSVTFAVSAASPDAPGIPAATLNAAAAITPQTVAPGSYVAIYGSALAESGYGLATTTPFSSTLDGTQVFLGGQAMPLYYASPTQINALVPQNLAANTVLQLVVQRGATRSAPIPLVITPYQPGLYSQNQAGTGQGSIQISGTALLAAPASTNSRPAQRGSDYIAIYCTGLGPVAGENGEPPPGDGVAAGYPPLYKTIAPVHVSIGGLDAPVVFSGLTPFLVGLYQIDAQVPDGAPVGDAVPVTIAVTDPATGAVSQSNMVTIAVQ